MRATVNRQKAVDGLADAIKEMTCAFDARGPYGRVFVQEDGLGVASYHFDSASNCYISYARAPAEWKLDDESTPPAKKPFTQTSFDPRTRTFRGVVEWPAPRTWGGETSWEYEMIFTDAFDAIESGRVTVRPDGSVLRFGLDDDDDDDALRYTVYTPP